jgi:hypothetical protein
LGSVLGVESASAQHLTRLVEASLCDGALPYARRQDVLRAARRLGVGRFQANLLIAAVQHRYDPPMAEPEPRRADRTAGWATWVVMIVVVEAFVLGALALTHV